MSKPYGAAVVESLRHTKGVVGRNVMRIAHFTSAILGTWFHESIPFVFVVAYTKSGNTWMGQLIADCLQLPMARNSLMPIGHPAVFHTHYCAWKGFRRGVYLVRDGRDVMTSLFYDTKAWHHRVKKQSLVTQDIAAFIEWQMTTWKPASSQVNWPKHVESYFRNDSLILVKNEDLHRDGEATLFRIITQVTGCEPDRDDVRAALQRYSFKKQTGREPGEESAEWARKGVPGDWVNHFTPAAAEVFDRYAGETLVKLGYEKDRSWVEDFRSKYRERES